MTRRYFLQTVAAVSAAQTFTLTTTRAQQEQQYPAGKKKRPIKKAVNLNMVKAGSTLEKFTIAKEAGFDGLELNRPDALPLDELLKARDATGLKFAGIICSTHWGKPLTDNNPAVREQGMRGLKLALQEAGELGCERLLLVPGVVNKEVSYADAWTRSLAAIKEAAPFAEKARCKIAVENVWNHFLLSPLEAARFVDEINSPWVGWHFDIGNVITFGWPEQWIRILGKRILNLHIKEFSRKKRDAEGLSKGFNVELGEGDVGWPDVMKALDEIQYDGWGIAEVPGGDASRMKFLAERMDKLFAS
jgi:hexulose-6-phosphate isomerase